MPKLHVLISVCALLPILTGCGGKVNGPQHQIDADNARQPPAEDEVADSQSVNEAKRPDRARNDSLPAGSSGFAQPSSQDGDASKSLTAAGATSDEPDTVVERTTAENEEQLPGITVGQKVTWNVDWDQASYSKEHEAYIHKYFVRTKAGDPLNGRLIAAIPQPNHRKVELRNARLTGTFSGFIELPVVIVDPITNQPKLGKGKYPFVTDAIIEQRK